MTLAERVAAIVQALPENGSVTLPVAELRQWLSENGAPSPASPAPADRWLKAEDVAKALGCSKRYVYAHRKDYPFAKELPGGGVRFSERGLQRWMDRKG